MLVAAVLFDGKNDPTINKECLHLLMKARYNKWKNNIRNSAKKPNILKQNIYFTMR